MEKSTKKLDSFSDVLKPRVTFEEGKLNVSKMQAFDIQLSILQLVNSNFQIHELPKNNVCFFLLLTFQRFVLVPFSNMAENPKKLPVNHSTSLASISSLWLG